MGGRSLKYSERMTYLRITFSKRLSRTDHIKSRYANVFTFQKDQKFCWKRMGVNVKPYSGIVDIWSHIVPKFTYGCLVWSHSLNCTNINLQNRVQRLGLTGASHSLWSTALAALETILGILPICLHMSALALATRFRTRPLLWDRWEGVGDKKKKGKWRLLDDHLNQHCPTQFPTDGRSRAKKWVQNDCTERTREQIFIDASKKGDDTSYGFLASQGMSCLAREVVPSVIPLCLSS